MIRRRAKANEGSILPLNSTVPSAPFSGSATGLITNNSFVYHSASSRQRKSDAINSKTRKKLIVWICLGVSASLIVFGTHRVSQTLRRRHETKQIGLNPKKHSQQRPVKPFVCSNGSHGYKDDDYCDCTDDGSDELHTSACSHILVQSLSFRCHDGTGAIYASRVGDGVQDCPDGSDETLSNRSTTKIMGKRVD